MIGTIAIVLWIVSVLGFIMFNLYQKNIKLENVVITQTNFINSLRSVIQESDKALKGLDDKIWLESDKELATVFQNLKAVQEALNQFKVN